MPRKLYWHPRDLTTNSQVLTSDTRFRYVFNLNPTDADISDLSPPPLLDFRTPEGRAAAIAWFESSYEIEKAARDASMAAYEAWEKRYLKWVQGGYCGLVGKAVKYDLTHRFTVPQASRIDTIGFKRLPNTE